MTIWATRPRSGIWDRLFLVVVALVVCIVAVSSFVFAQIFHVNPIWIFFAGNSILMIPMFVREFRAFWKDPAFIAFFLVWMIVHGLLIVCLMRWSELAFWPVFILLELSAGFVTAHWLFGVPLNTREGDDGPVS